VVSLFVRFVVGVVLVLVLVACPATPVGGVQSVAIVGDDRALVVGESVALEVDVATTGGASAAVAWSSDASGAVAVDPVSGVATALAPGSGTVTATSVADPSRADSITIAVDPPAVLNWTRQFGTVAEDHALGVAVDVDGRPFVAGYTFAALEGASAGGLDAFLQALDADGGLRWTRQFGGSSSDIGRAVAVDALGRPVIVGITATALAGTHAGGNDAFLRAYDADGDLRWERQWGTAANDSAADVAVDAAGRVVVAGTTAGVLDGGNAGGSDAFVRVYDASGVVLWTRQFGTGGNDAAGGVAVDGAGRLFVAGYVSGALEGVHAGSFDVFLRAYDVDGAVLWTRQFGTTSLDEGYALAVGPSGGVVVVGRTGGVLPGSTGAGGQDAFVRAYDADGDVRWTHQFGTAGQDWAFGVAVDGDGGVVVVGRTEGALAGAQAGSGDAFVRAYDAEGTERWTRQFGTGSEDGLSGVAVDPSGRSTAVGSTEGALVGVSAGGADAIVRSYGR
jgi:hypothetical protein